VRRFRAGDRVFGFTGFGVGANAEYKCLSERASITTMPANVTYAEAAATVDGFTTAWYLLRHLANVQSGQKVLTIGASRSIGTYAVRSYPMAEIVEAYRYVGSGHKIGNVVITVVDD
jgi:NADPH:quinone reductase-like Zn-dependent oxidoreductase